MSQDTIQIKVKFINDIESKWENLPIFAEMTVKKANTLVNGLVNSFAVYEIRWNYTGCTQGHYDFGHWSDSIWKKFQYDTYGKL